jgi:iron complex outermembrane receptor protein
MTKVRELDRAIMRALAIALASTAIAAPVYAQSDEEESTRLETITVTGSRIRQAEIETAAPVLTITREEIKNQGFRTVADILQNISAAGAPPLSRAQPLSGGEGAGGQYVQLRQLGANRTLVLINGKRLGINTGGNQDISIIPASIIERVEVLKDGASSIYGSDAIAGVINLITRQNFQGVETTAYVGEFDEGDGRTERYDFTMGSVTDTTSLVFTIDYGKEEVVRAADRSFSAFPLGPFYPDRNWTVVGQFGGFVTSATQPVPGVPNGTRVVLRPGGNPRNPGDFVPQQTSGTDNRFTTNTLQQTDLRSPLETRNIFVSGSHNFNDDVRLRAEALYSGRQADRRVAGFPVQAAANGPSPLSSSSIYNPFSTRAAGPGGTQVASGTTTIGNWWRRTWEVPRASGSDADTYRASSTLEGNFQAWDRYFDWDVGAMYQLNRITQTSFGNVNLTRLRQAVGPSFINASGAAQCGTPTAPIPLGAGQNSCVPFNPFLPAGVQGSGGLTNNQLLQEYLFQRETATGETSTTMFNANLTGGLFELPAGTLAFATGVEVRKEQGEFVPDALAVTGESTNPSSRATDGSYNVDEYYVEFAVPVLADLPFAQSLNFSIASRYSDYDTFGDTTNSKFGLEYRPIRDVLVRGTWAEGFRAPTIADLFAGGSQSFVFYTDPCDPVFGAAASSAATRTNCARDIANYANFRQLRQGFTPVQGPNEQTPLAFFQGTGNSTLTPETSVSKTLGIVYSPGFVEGLNVSLDWWNIRIEDLIIGDTIGLILGDCYVSGIASRCNPALFTRDPVNGIVNSALIGRRNAGYQEVEGYDLGVNYRLSTGVGDFSLNWQSTYTSFDEFKGSNIAADLPQQNVGFASTAGVTFRIRSNATLNWNLGNWGASWTTRYFSSITETCLGASIPNRECSDPNYIAANPVQTRPVNTTGAVAFHDLQVRWNAPWDATISVGANNIGERAGPILYSQPSANVNYYGGFDIGRFWYASYTQRF